jgi:hypothetical protein
MFRLTNTNDILLVRICIWSPHTRRNRWTPKNKDEKDFIYRINRGTLVSLYCLKLMRTKTFWMHESPGSEAISWRFKCLFKSWYYYIFILFTINSEMQFQTCIYSFTFFNKHRIILQYIHSVGQLVIILCYVLHLSSKNIRESP